MTTYYDFQINLNEWTIIISIIIFYWVIILLPKQYPLSTTMLLILFGMFFGWLLDQTLAVKPFDFYDINDSSKYEWFDVGTYILYGPFSYFFIYFYDRFNIKGLGHVFYIALWILLALICEKSAENTGIFHYKNEYKLLYSTSIYCLIQTVFLFTYVIFLKKENNYHSKKY